VHETRIGHTFIAHRNSVLNLNVTDIVQPGRRTLLFRATWSSDPMQLELGA